MQIIVLKNDDNSVSTITPGTVVNGIEDLVKTLPAKSVYSIVESEDIVALDHDGFIEARVYSDEYPHVEVDLTRAKNIWKDKIRKARKPILEQLDVQYMRALEDSDASALKSIKAKKQELRDITSHKDLTSAKTLQKIRSFWPSVLSAD